MVCTLQIYGIPFCNGFWDVQNKKKTKTQCPPPFVEQPLIKTMGFFFQDETHGHGIYQCCQCHWAQRSAPRKPKGPKAIAGFNKGQIKGMMMLNHRKIWSFFYFFWGGIGGGSLWFPWTKPQSQSFSPPRDTAIGRSPCLVPQFKRGVSPAKTNGWMSPKWWALESRWLRLEKWWPFLVVYFLIHLEKKNDEIMSAIFNHLSPGFDFKVDPFPRWFSRRDLSWSPIVGLVTIRPNGHVFTHHPQKVAKNCQVHSFLVGGFNPSEKY